MTDSYTLALDGSTYQGSVALLRGSEVVAERTLKDEDGASPRGGRGERLMPAIADCLRDGGVEGGEIARIVCGSGPGSFTSLRIAGSVAKGLAVGYGIDLYSVSSLLLIVTGARPPVPSGEYLSVLDAMRGEFYAARIALHHGVANQIEAPRIISTALLEELRAADYMLKVIGPDQQIDAHPHARGVASLLETVTAKGPVQLAAWEPDYGRLAEAQVRWEAAHGRKLAT